MITMFLGGLWHGASWTFAVWGILHGAYLCVNHAFRQRSGKSTAASSSLPARCLAWTVTFIAVVVGWVIFRADSLRSAGVIISGMFVNSTTGGSLEWRTLWMIVAGMGFLWVPDTLDIFAAYDVPLCSSSYGIRHTRYGAVGGVVIGILFIICVALMEHRSEFLYFRF